MVTRAMEALAYSVLIQDVETGQVRRFQDEWCVWRPGETWPPFRWTGGNYGCDCNRELCYRRSGGEDPFPDVDLACGEARFRVTVLREDGVTWTEERAR
jgi:hypothetical protein